MLIRVRGLRNAGVFEFRTRVNPAAVFAVEFTGRIQAELSRYSRVETGKTRGVVFFRSRNFLVSYALRVGVGVGKRF